ncbi:major royal jelly protein 1-like, partial [Belonocnema kinseyi]|uniref:major royal jelly protein 1-like n=1 Tax=Belonocnema kinseyi TaxID=2817044 RepID=UPI00143DC00E
LLFNLETNELLGRTKIPNRLSQNSERNEGLLMTPIVQTEGIYCERARVFIADVIGYGLITINRPYGWRLEGPYFAPDAKPKSAQVTILGDTFTLSDGLFGMALTPKIGNNPQYLAFRPFASRNLYAATVDNILATNFGEKLHYYNFTDVFPSQTTAQAFSSEATLFFGITEQIAIGCWNQYRNLVPENIKIVAQDDETLQFASGVKVIPKSITGTEEKLLVATNRYQKIALGTMNFNESNFRILTQSVQKLIRGTKCEAPRAIKEQIMC